MNHQQNISRLTGFWCIVFLMTLSHMASATVYYVSSSDGDDDNSGLTVSDPFETVGRVNNLTLIPGDEVRFKCGDMWHGEMLIITDSGNTTDPIIVSSYPENCHDKPILSGSLPISEWTSFSQNIYRADLTSGANAGKFPLGINQLFRDGARIRLGRWPNIDGHSDGGYSTVDSHNPSQNRITDNELPLGDWTGAAIHIKGIRWYIMNREVVDSGLYTLTLNDDVTCFTGDCAGWGYFINSHLNTLDQENEWFYDASDNSVYLYTTSGQPTTGELEGSVILAGDGDYLGGIILGTHLWAHITDVIIDNFEIKNWFSGGITFPLNFELDDPERVVLRNNIIKDVNETGIRLCSWVWNADNNSGWRGGEDLTIENNVIDGANFYGIDCFTSSSVFEGNQIRNIALIENMNREGMGCGFSGINCTENGAGIRLKVHLPEYSGHDNTIQYNTIQRVGMQGIDVFGPGNIIQNNVIDQACFSKGDCGGVRTFGGSDYSNTNAENITISDNIIISTVGNTDGCHPDFDPLFGFGIYVDHYSDNVTVSNNTVLNCSVAGVLVQNSRAEVTGSVLHNNANGDMTTGQFVLTGSASEVTFTNNVMYSISDNQRTMSVRDAGYFSQSDNNYFFNPYRDASVMVQQTGYQTYTLEEWQTYSGLDNSSHKHWFNLEPAAAPRSEVFFNPSPHEIIIRLGVTIYEDLDQNPVVWSIVLAPYSSIILIDTGQEMEILPTANPLLLLALFSGFLVFQTRRNHIRKR